jgi:hypothetical protein
MTAIKTDPSAKENTQGRHYTPESAPPQVQVPDPITPPTSKIASGDSELLKLG